MQTIVGTSGYSYKEWKGIFYPEDLAAAKMLSYYASHFGSVEINNTFYRMPEEKTMAKWESEVPDGFTFALKAPQRITHQKKLVDVADDVRHLFEVAAALGGKLGPVLFQLPPFARKDAAKLRDFAERLPRDKAIAFEFRHASWFDDEIFDILRSHGAALCIADTDEVADPDSIVHATADWGYLRLRRTEYDDAGLRAWRSRIESQPWTRAYLFFKHEDEAKGPRFAKRYLELEATSGAAAASGESE